MSRKMVTIEEAATLLHVHTRTVRKFIAEGRLPAFRLGKRSVRIYEDDLEGLFTPIGQR